MTDQVLFQIDFEIVNILRPSTEKSVKLNVD